VKEGRDAGGEGVGLGCGCTEERRSILAKGRHNIEAVFVTYSFAKTPLNAAKAPEPSAHVSHWPDGLGVGVVEAGGALVLKSLGDGRGSSGCSAVFRGIVASLD